MTQRRNRIIVLLLTIGIVGFGIVIGIKGQMTRQRRYQAAQMNPLTNDAARLVPFKNAYVGDAANDYNLSTQLPLGAVPHTIAIDPAQRSLEIRYQQSVGTLGIQTLESSLVYNATANFALIGNLNSLTFVFPGTSFHTTRVKLQSWYGGVPTLSSRSSWNRKVQQKLSHPRYVRGVFAKLFDRTERKL